MFGGWVLLGFLLAPWEHVCGGVGGCQSRRVAWLVGRAGLNLWGFASGGGGWVGLLRVMADLSTSLKWFAEWFEIAIGPIRVS